MRRGVDTSLPLWSAAALTAAPNVVAAIHRDYVAAGADILVANTFPPNCRPLRDAGKLADGAARHRPAIGVARSAVGTGGDDGERRVLAAAGVAPVEDCYHPERVPDEQTLQREHTQMAGWLAAAEPDLIWIETMNTVREARYAAAAAADAGLPLAVSFVVREDGRLLSGETLADAVASVLPFEPLALGLNCIPPAGMTANLPRLRRATKRPLCAYAHIGNPEPIVGWSFSSDVSPEEYARCAEAWLDLGVSVVGGCCGTTPAHIGALRALVDRRRAAGPR